MESTHEPMNDVAGQPGPPPNDHHQTTTRPVGYQTKTLDRRDHMVAGVAGGLAHYLGADVTLIRLLIVALTLVAGPVIPILYVAAWIIVPDGRREGATPPPPTPPAPSAGAPSPAAMSDPVAH